MIAKTMFKRLFGQILLHLGEMEEEFRLFHLRDDIATFIITAVCLLLANAIMLRVDFILYRSSMDLFYLIIPLRSLQVLLSGAFLFLVYRTTQVQKFDIFVFTWLLLNVIYFSLFNFTRPADYMATTFDLLFIFGLYLLSPLQLKQTLALSVSLSLGSLYVTYYYKSGIPDFIVGSTTGAHLFIHMLGLASALQIQSFKRRAFQAYARERKAHEITQDLLRIDALTKALSRRYFFEQAQREFERSKQLNLPLSVLIIDLDHFKKINDSNGHHAGDEVLSRFGRFILHQKRSQDLFGRLGGEEFSIALPETKTKDAQTTARLLQTAWVDTPVKVDSKVIHSTMSIGIAELSQSDRNFDELLNRADTMMYKAKQRGRNRVAHK